MKKNEQDIEKYSRCLLRASLSVRTCLVLLLGLAACTATKTAQPVFVEKPCTMSQGSPYPDGIPYVGVHANAANNDLTGCPLADRFALRWQVLQGKAIAQPNTFGPDGQTVYVTTLGKGCNMFALKAEDGAQRWCKTYPESVVASAPEVDAQGNIYLTFDKTVLALDAGGKEIWKTLIDVSDGVSMTTDTTVGLHFTPDGHIATVTASGVVVLVDRKTGKILDTFSIPARYGFVPLSGLKLKLNILASLPENVQQKMANWRGISVEEMKQKGNNLFAMLAGSSGGFADNTAGISSRNEIFVVGGGLTPDTGALVQIRITGAATAPVLEPGWFLPTEGGSASSPSISPDGQYVNISDRSSLVAILTGTPQGRIHIVDIDACDKATAAVTEAAQKRCTLSSISLLQGGASAGSIPMDNGGLTYVWESGLTTNINSTGRDLAALDPSGLIWESILPDGLTWSSVMTVTRDHIVGTASRIIPGDFALLGYALPATSQHFVVAVQRSDGKLVLKVPVSDDATSTVTIGPDGSLYVAMLGLISVLGSENDATLGLARFSPIK